MSWYEWTGYGFLGFLLYGFIALVSETINFDWRLAFGILGGIFIFETLVNLFGVLFSYTNKVR